MRQRLARDTGALAAGTVANGVLAYVFFALVTRDLGAANAAPVSVLWSYWGTAGAVLTFPLQHWIIRTMAAGREPAVAGAMRRVWVGTVAVTLLSGLVAYATRQVLFNSSGVAFPLLLAAVTFGSCCMGVMRGGLAGRSRFVATGAAMFGENLVRVGGAVAAAATGASAVVYGAALAGGPLICLLWASSMRFERDQATPRKATSPAGTASGLAVGSLVAQVVLTGGPVVLAAIGGAPAEITALFVALALWRAPYLLALGLANQLTGFLTRLVVARDARRLRAVRLGTVLVALGGATIAVVLGWNLAGHVLQAVFGSDITVDRAVMIALGVGTALALSDLVLLLLLLARGQARLASGAWLAAFGVAAGIVAFGPLDPLSAVVSAFVVAQATACALMLAADRWAAAQTAEPSADDAEAPATWAAPPGT